MPRDNDFLMGLPAVERDGRVLCARWPFFVLAAIFVFACLVGCRYPEARYVAADESTLNLFEPKIREMIMAERKNGDADLARFWETKLESWRDRVNEAKAEAAKKPQPPKSPTPSQPNPIPSGPPQ